LPRERSRQTGITAQSWDPVSREREAEEAAKKEEARQARLFEEEAEAERTKAMKEASSFGGCYSALASIVLNLLPQKVGNPFPTPCT